MLRALPVGRLVADVTTADVVVVGSGVAGLAAAYELATGPEPRSVALITKTRLGVGGSSVWAQGGVAVAIGADDSAAEHAGDTLAAGAGLCDAETVAELVAEGPRAIRRLIALGARFDRDAEGRLLLGREGAHGHRRILHAGGDATGAEMVRALVAAVRGLPRIAVHERAFALDLVLEEGRVAGVVVRHPRGLVVEHRSAAVVLATGGFGQLFARTTNPVEATGDGLAMAARAGARLADLELVQFHPTALDTGGDPLPLLTEALRGEGAVLIDDRGERFMPAEHPAAELAPRDVVARAIWRRLRAGRRVYLDATSAVGERFPERFPTVFGHCRRAGLDPRREAMPVTPAAHYAMAGVAVDADGRASLPGLWACGEVASSGAHGANRLASNSLLEALVFGARVAEDVAAAPGLPLRPAAAGSVRREPPRADALGDRALRAAVRSLAWRHAGLERDHRGLTALLGELGRLSARRPGEAANLLSVGRLVAAAALAREESRGAHFRSDHPEERPEQHRRLFWTYTAAEGFPLRPSALPSTDQAEREIA